jgi:Flp pilus assembly pilin Flp
MKTVDEKKKLIKTAQTAIEYLLLLTICALIVFAGFRTFFEPGGRVRNGLDLYFNSVSGNLMGDGASLDTTPPITVPPPPPTACTYATAVDCVAHSECMWRLTYGTSCGVTISKCATRGPCSGVNQVFSSGICCSSHPSCTSDPCGSI